MPRKYRTKFQHDRDLLKIADLYLQGYPQAYIGQELKMHQTGVSKDLVLIRQRWCERYTQDYNDIVNEQLAKLDRIELEAWNAWTKSKQIRKRITSKSRIEEIIPDTGVITNPELNKIEETVTEEETVGDPRFLQVVGGCIERRCKILGIDASTKFDYSKGEPREPVLSESERARSLLALFRVTAAEKSKSDRNGTDSMGTDQ